MSEGTRTPDRLDHNQELYQLSYAHRGGLNLAMAGHMVVNGSRVEPATTEASYGLSRTSGSWSEYSALMWTTC